MEPTHLPTYALQTIEAIRQVEQHCVHLNLMQRAAEQCYQWIVEHYPIAGSNKKILIVVGRGNNGGDALATAILLHNQGYAVDVFCPYITGASNAQSVLSAQANVYLHAWLALIQPVLIDFPESSEYQLIVDGLYGIGLSRALSAKEQAVIDDCNAYKHRHRTVILSLDCPSGICARTGGLIANPPIEASTTMTFIAHKVGLWTGPALNYVGQVILDTLGIDATAFAKVVPAAMLMTPTFCSQTYLTRGKDSHKGSYGSVGIVGGNASMVGAILLAGRMSLKCGAGKTHLFALSPTPPLYDSVTPELMFHPPAQLNDYALSALVCGPGLGKTDSALQTLHKVLSLPIPLVLDADALNLIAEQQWFSMVAARNAPTVITPHPTEAARLLRVSTQDVQQDRLKASKALSQQLQAICVLKGAGTVVTLPDDTVTYVNQTGNPALATGGTGDVLAGLIGGLIAQKVSDIHAIVAYAVCVHGHAADVAAETHQQAIGLTASELIDYIRECINC